MTPIVLRLREIREAKGLTQADLAEAAGVRRATISDLETGKSANTTLDLVDRLCTALSVEPAELIVRVPRRKR